MSPYILITSPHKSCWTARNTEYTDSGDFVEKIDKKLRGSAITTIGLFHKDCVDTSIIDKLWEE